MIADTAKIFPNVKLGDNVTIEDFCVIGSPPSGSTENHETIIGDNAIIRSHTVIYAGNKIGKNFQTGNKVNIRELNIIGDNVSIGTLSVVEHHVEIEQGVRVHSQVFIPEFSKLCKDSWLGPNVVLTNAKYPNRADTKDKLEGPVVGEAAVVGANSTLLPGIKVGDRSVIGAGTIVTRSIESDQVAYGQPLKVKKRTHQ